MTTGTNIATEVRLQLNDGDASAYRWSDAEILSYINAGQRQIVLFVPEANVQEDTVTVSDSEVRRALPTGGIKFFRAWNYDAVASTRGPQLTPVELDALDIFPEWPYPNHLGSHLDFPTNSEEHSSVYFEHCAHDPRSPNTYYIFPPFTGANNGQVSLLGSSNLVTGNIVTGTPVTGSYTLPTGTDNRLILVAIQVSAVSGGYSGDPDTTGEVDSLVVTYGGVTLNVVGYQYIEGHTLALAAISTNGQSFANTTLSIGVFGSIAPSEPAVIAKVYVYDGVDPAYDDFSYDYVESNTSAASLALSAVSPGGLGDLVFSMAIEDDATADALAFSCTDSAEYTLYPITADTTETAQAGENTSFRVAYSMNVSDAQTITWTPNDTGRITAAAVVFPAAAATAQLKVQYSKLPTALTALSDTFALNDEYLNAEIEYVMFRCLMKDGRYGMDTSRRQDLWNNFRAALGLKPEVEKRVDPAGGRAGGDANG